MDASWPKPRCAVCRRDGSIVTRFTSCRFGYLYRDHFGYLYPSGLAQVTEEPCAYATGARHFLSCLGILHRGKYHSTVKRKAISLFFFFTPDCCQPTSSIFTRTSYESCSSPKRNVARKWEIQLLLCTRFHTLYLKTPTSLCPLLSTCTLALRQRRFRETIFEFRGRDTFVIILDYIDRTTKELPISYLPNREKQNNRYK